MASIKADKVVDNWLTVIENGAGQGDELYGAMDESLEEIKLPYVKWRIAGIYNVYFCAGRWEAFRLRVVLNR